MASRPEIHQGSLATVSALRVEGGVQRAFEDILAVEEPLEIRLDFKGPVARQEKSVSITMRTPGHDFELAAGFLYTEGILSHGQQIEHISHCGPDLPRLGSSNVVKLRLKDDTKVELSSLERHFYTSSSCGVCGKSSIEALRIQALRDRSHNLASELRLPASLIPALPPRLRAAQDLFESTGGLHASALFSEDGTLQVIREDVGRHNALDKVIGHAFLQNTLPLRSSLLMLSGRISFELVQKAAMAGIPAIAAVGAPSSLALELAKDVGMVLLGFVRGDRYNVYCGEERII